MVLGLRKRALHLANVTESKTYGEVFRRFTSTIRLDPAYVDRMLNARYTRNFYTNEERETMRRKYS